MGVALDMLTLAAGLLGPSGGRAGGHAPLSPASHLSNAPPLTLAKKPHVC